MRKHDSQRHVLLGLIGSIAKHDALVTGANLLKRAVVQGLSDVRRLLFDGDEDVAGLVVKTLGRVVVSDLFNRVADDFLVVYDGFGADFAKDHDHASLGGSLTGNLGKRVLLEASIELHDAFCQKRAA